MNEQFHQKHFGHISGKDKCVAFLALLSTFFVAGIIVLFSVFVIAGVLNGAATILPWIQ